MVNIRSNIKTVDLDLGAELIIKEAAKLRKDPFVKVGILGSSGKHDGPGEMTVVDVAQANEFGTRSTLGNVQTPERSFIRSTFDEKEATIRKYIDNYFDLILSGRTTVEGALGNIGLMVQSFIRSKINEISDPPNAPSTVKAKGSSKPLIDTGQMRKAVDFEVVMDGSTDTSGEE